MASTEIAVADTERRMGRPSLGVRPTTVRLPLDTIARIEALDGLGKLAAFIRRAVEKELQRQEQ